MFYGDCVAGADQWVRPYVRRVRFRLWECPLFFFAIRRQFRLAERAQFTRALLPAESASSAARL